MIGACGFFCGLFLFRRDKRDSTFLFEKTLLLYSDFGSFLAITRAMTGGWSSNLQQIMVQTVK